MVEKIVVSAVLFLNCPDPDKFIRGKILIKNTHSEGVIVCGFRHLHCRNFIEQAGFFPEQNDIVSGFIAKDETGNKRFVDRAQAGAIAYKAGQIEIDSLLSSEAIYPPKNNDILGYNLQELTQNF